MIAGCFESMANTILDSLTSLSFPLYVTVTAGFREAKPLEYRFIFNGFDCCVSFLCSLCKADNFLMLKLEVHQAGN
jgi:hypothetical protein